MTIWCAGLDEMRVSNGRLYRVTYTRCRINSPDDVAHDCPKHVENRNKHTRKELCIKLVIYKDYTKMHGQQNIKFYSILLLTHQN